ncbi:hypothetical protein POUND7_007693 [Theobroma cacao]
MNTAAPFETESAILTMFVITTLVYAVAWAIEAKLETRSNSYHHVILSNISLLLESLATVFLVLILVPGLGYFILLIWAIYFVGLTYGAWRKLYLLYNAISSVSDLLNELLGRRGLHNEEIIQCSTSRHILGIAPTSTENPSNEKNPLPHPLVLYRHPKSTFGSFMVCQLYSETSSASDFLNKLLGHRDVHNEEIIQYFTSSDNTTGSNHKHAILRFLIAALLALSPQKFHSMNTSAAPFENHSTILSMFVITTLVYAVAWAIETKLGTINSSYHLLMSNISLLLGTLATVLLVLVHVPGLGTGLAIKPLKSCSYSAFKITYKGILTKAYTATSKFLTLLTKEETNLLFSCILFSLQWRPLTSAGWVASGIKELRFLERRGSQLSRSYSNLKMPSHSQLAQ